MLDSVCNGFFLPLLATYSFSSTAPGFLLSLCSSRGPSPFGDGPVPSWATHDWSPSGVSLLWHESSMGHSPLRGVLALSRSTSFQECISSCVPSKCPLPHISSCVSSGVSSHKSSGESTCTSCLCQLPPFLKHIQGPYVPLTGCSFGAQFGVSRCCQVIWNWPWPPQVVPASSYTGHPVASAAHTPPAMPNETLIEKIIFRTNLHVLRKRSGLQETLWDRNRLWDRKKVLCVGPPSLLWTEKSNGSQIKLCRFLALKMKDSGLKVRLRLVKSSRAKSFSKLGYTFFYCSLKLWETSHCYSNALLIPSPNIANIWHDIFN